MLKKIKSMSFYSVYCTAISTCKKLACMYRTAASNTRFKHEGLFTSGNIQCDYGAGVDQVQAVNENLFTSGRLIKHRIDTHVIRLRCT